VFNVINSLRPEYMESVIDNTYKVREDEHRLKRRDVKNVAITEEWAYILLS